MDKLCILMRSSVTMHASICLPAQSGAACLTYCNDHELLNVIPDACHSVSIAAHVTVSTSMPMHTELQLNCLACACLYDGKWRLLQLVCLFRQYLVQPSWTRPDCIIYMHPAAHSSWHQHHHDAQAESTNYLHVLCLHMLASAPGLLNVKLWSVEHAESSGSKHANMTCSFVAWCVERHARRTHAILCCD